MLKPIHIELFAPRTAVLQAPPPAAFPAPAIATGTPIANDASQSKDCDCADVPPADRKSGKRAKRRHPSSDRRKCPCVIRVLPFNCNGGSCQFGGQMGTEPGGIRSAHGPDPVHLLLEIQLANPNGKVKTRRIAPIADWQETKQRILVNTPCKLEQRCLLAFTVGIGGGAPPVVPQGMPFTDRELYEVTISGDDCETKHEVGVVDCDSIIAAYLQVEALTRTAAGNPVDETMHMFFARLATNGGRALAKKYWESAVTGPRSFRDFYWAALISAVLAEDMLIAFSAPPGPPSPWGQFFAIPDRTLSFWNPMALDDFTTASRRFGRAHTRDGVAKAVTAIYNNPCCAADILTIHATLVAAQRPLLAAASGVPGVMATVFTLGMKSPAQQFSDALSHYLKRGLVNAGRPNCAAQLP